MAGEWLGECRAWGPGQGGGGAKHGSSGGLCSGGGTGASDKLKPPQRPRGHGAASGEQWHPQERSVLGQRGKGRCGFLGRLGGGGGGCLVVRERGPGWGRSAAEPGGGVGSLRVPISPATHGPGFTDAEVEAGVRGEVPPGGPPTTGPPPQGFELPLESMY